MGKTYTGYTDGEAIQLSKKWEDDVGYQLSWQEVIICELLNDPDNVGEYIPKTIDAGESPVNAFTAIIELSHLTGENNRIEDELAARMANSPDWSEGYKLFAKELEGELQFNELPDDYNHSFVEWIAEPFNRKRFSLKQIVYRDRMAGKNSQVKDYSVFLYPYREHLYAEFFQTLISDMARAAAIAQIMPKLKDDGFSQDQARSNNQAKLKWIGSPDEFSSIIHILIDKGFIQEGRTTTELTALALNSFLVTSNRKSSVAAGTLRNNFTRGKSLNREFEKLKSQFPFSTESNHLA